MQSPHIEQVKYCIGLQPAAEAGVPEETVDALKEGTADTGFSLSQLHGLVLFTNRKSTLQKMCIRKLLNCSISVVLQD